MIHHLEKSANTIYRVALVLLWHGEPAWINLIILYANILQLVPVTPTALVQRADLNPKDCTISSCETAASVLREIY